MWKKVFAVLLISTLLLTGCGKDKETNDEKDKNDVKENKYNQNHVNALDKKIQE